MKGAFATIFALVASAAAVMLLSEYLSGTESLMASALAARENKQMFYSARNFEETFWQALAETAATCGSCAPEELAARASANVLIWKGFWLSQGAVIVEGSHNPQTGMPSAGGSTRIESSVVNVSAGRLFSFSVQSAGIYGQFGRTWGGVAAGEERRCLVSAGKCEWII